MIQNATPLLDAYKVFIKDVIANNQVWTLVKNDEMALIDAQLYDDAVSTLFFSNISAAFLLKEEQWPDYDVVAIQLSSFLEQWLVGLYNQDILVAAIWNDVATGREFEPLELLLEFLDEIQATNFEINFNNYYSVADFLKKIKSTLED